MGERQGQGPITGTRDKVIGGALECLRELGRSGTSIAAVSRASGVSRPTIYAHFSTLDELVHQAVESAAVELSRRIGRTTSAAPSPGLALVEFVVTAQREFRADPVVRHLVELTLTGDHGESGHITTTSYRLTGQSLRRLFPPDDPALDRLDEISETFNRFLLSVLSYTSENTSTDERLRDYLTRVLIPALGLT